MTRRASCGSFALLLTPTNLGIKCQLLFTASVTSSPSRCPKGRCHLRRRGPSRHLYVKALAAAFSIDVGLLHGNQGKGSMGSISFVGAALTYRRRIGVDGRSITYTGTAGKGAHLGGDDAEKGTEGC